MNKFLWIALIAVGFCSCDVRRKDKIADDMQAEAEKATKDSTTVQVIDALYNFGKVTEGEKVEYNFRFKNTGKKPLVIGRASASCGCTVAEKPEQPVLPGEMGAIKVVFNSSGKHGHNEKTITVISNASPAFPPLLLVGDVEEDPNKK